MSFYYPKDYKQTQCGMSMISVMMASAIVGILVVTTTTLLTNSVRTQRQLEVRNELNNLKSYISNNLSCVDTFNTSLNAVVTKNASGVVTGCSAAVNLFRKATTPTALLPASSSSSGGTGGCTSSTAAGCDMMGPWEIQATCNMGTDPPCSVSTPCPPHLKINVRKWRGLAAPYNHNPDYANDLSTANSSTPGKTVRVWDFNHPKANLFGSTGICSQSFQTAGDCPTSPTSFTRIGQIGLPGTFCIDTNERTATTFFAAKTVCDGLGLSQGVASLCTQDQWQKACAAGTPVGMTGGWEWISQLTSSTTSLIVGNPGCSDYYSQTITGFNYSYRCCINPFAD